MLGHQSGHLIEWEPLSQHTGALIRLLNIAEKENGFRLVVAIFSDTVYRSQMIARLGKLVTESKCLDIEAEYDFFEVLNQLYRLPPNTALLHLIGATAWLQDSSRATDLLHGLNYQREQLAANCPFVIVLWLYDSQVRDLAQNAPDMWAWRAAVLDFALLLEPETILTQREIVTDQADSHERHERLADIETYLSGKGETYASDAALFREMARIYALLGDISQAEEASRKACKISREHDDKKGIALAVGFLAHIFKIRGELDEALRIHKEEELPVYKRLGEVRLIAITKGKIANILQSRGELDEALRIRTEEELPVYERRGEVRLIATTKGEIADILQLRGELDEALRIRTEEELPVYERLGEVRSIVVTKGQIADILQSRGELDEALRIRTEEELPVYERLGEVRLIAITKGKIAGILQSRGELDEALRIRTEEELPVYERLGEVRLIAVALNSLFDLYWEAQQFQKAYEVVSRAFTIVVQLDIPDGISAVGIKLGRAMIRAKQPKEAKNVLMQSRDAAAKLRQADRVKAIDTLLAKQDEVASNT